MALDHADLHGTVLLRDCLEADGGFLLLQLMKMALTGEPAHDVVLVAIRNSAAHWAAAARKAGLGFPALQAQGRLAVIDVLDQIASAAAAAEQPPGAPLISLRSLATNVTVAAAATAGGTEQPLCLLIDDVSALACASGDSASLLPFLHSCRSLGARLQRPFCLVALVHGDIDADAAWVQRLEHTAATVVDVKPLGFGRSAEVTGRVAVVRQQPRALQYLESTAAGPAKGQMPALGEQVLYYRLAENGAASFFPQLMA